MKQLKVDYTFDGILPCFWPNLRFVKHPGRIGACRAVAFLSAVALPEVEAKAGLRPMPLTFHSASRYYLFYFESLWHLSRAST